MQAAPSRSFAVRSARRGDVAHVQRLASEIWHLHYPGIISTAQIEYMLARGYSDQALQSYLDTPGAGLALAVLGSEDVGFVAWCRGEAPGVTRLDKLYVLPREHGQGIGRRLISHVEAAARDDGATGLVLNVARRNERSIAAYRKCGFVVREAQVADIGGGFSVDDYVMTKALVLDAWEDLR